MNYADQISETIGNYLTGQMSERERLVFEQKIAEDKKLADAVDEARFTHEAIYYANLAILKENVGRDIKNIKYKPGFNINTISLLAISAALVAGLVGILIAFSLVFNPERDKKENLTSENMVKITPDTLSLNKKPIAPEKTKKSNQKNTDNGSFKNTEKGLKQNGGESNKPIVAEPETKRTPAKDFTLNAAQQDAINKDSVSVKKNKPIVNETVMPISASPDAKDNTTPCDKSFEIQTSPSCKQKPTGKITVVDGNLQELNLTVDKHYTSHINGVFNDLMAGNHNVTITYNQTCSYEKKVKIDEKWCPLNNSYSFNPDYGEKWELQYEDGSLGNYVIYDKFGKEVYEQKFGAGNEYWTGVDYQGNVLPIGTYIAFINYSDGRKEKVELTIVR